MNKVVVELERGTMETSCEDERTEYLNFPDGLRVIFRDKQYVGWYLPGEVAE